MPYDYGMFTDNDTLIPVKSLLEFSRWYYLLDLVLLFLAYITVKGISKFQLHKPVLIFFAIFYVALSIPTLIEATSKVNKNKQRAGNSIFYSNNHQNVLYLIFDGFGSFHTQYSLTNNTMPEHLTNWAKDFTFYNNVTCFSLAYTPPSYPTLYNGYESVPQKVWYDIFTGTLPPSINSFYKMQDIQFKTQLNKIAHVKYFTSAPLSLDAPIFLINIYSRMPYGLRWLIANDSSWKFSNYQTWTKNVNHNDKIGGKAEATKKPVIIIGYSLLSHHPWNSKKSKFTNQFTNRQVFEQHLFYNTEEVFDIISQHIDHLKKENVYSNTTIIIASDHGTHENERVVRPDIITSYLNDIADMPNSTWGARHVLPSLLMVKHPNTVRKKMVTDNRFLSLADIRGIIDTAVGLKNNPDYTTIMPPKRIFNIPILGWGEVHDIISIDQKVRYNRIKKMQKKPIRFYKLSNAYPFSASEFKVDIDTMSEVPPYELIN